ncbi:MAG: CoA transferase [Gammaproteobacteria bacterium]|nr:CoA transferase [Gammaproteobacteria bacterium]MBT5204933.1 CoA transferase [Gammaproteobacteria bacterium]MBT5600893.1 CoA transferase [Gammaproteobacteria bacterium]MBT6247117.1 CoA transferase [Gammaproteobacteria bacterium]
MGQLCSSRSGAILNPYRVLDLTDHRGDLAGMILADLGADVIKIEPPLGASTRYRTPLIKNGTSPEASLHFFAYNRNKRSIVLDLDLAQDRQIFDELVCGADFLLESFPDGLLATRGIDFTTLTKLNPTLIHVVVSPYGTDGPNATRIANDLTLSAMGGQASLQGSPDRPPVRVSIPQVWRHASAQAAAAAMIAHARMLVTGKGQYVDVSAQCSVTWTMMNAMHAYAIQGFEFEQMGSTVQMGTRAIDPVFECADGYLVAIPIGSLLNGLLGHIAADDLVDVEWLTEDWATFDARMAAGEEMRFTSAEIRDLFARYFLRHTKEALFALGFEAGVTLAPINTVADLTEFNQLKARGAWHDTVLPQGEPVLAPGLFAKMNQAPMRFRYPPPRLNEHDHEIRTEVANGIRLRLPPPPPVDSDAPFKGLKVLDLTWVIAGPASVRYLADHGATVIKVESELRPDALRFLGPVKGDQGWNRSHFYGEFNAGKKCVQLQLKEPKAREMLGKLVEWADVLVENWAPGATKRLGIDYPSCAKINPDLIMLSTSLLGQNGPMASLAGFGYHAAGMAGFYEVTGWPDRPPHGPWLAYTDVIAPHFIATTICAALDHRRRTGQGQHIDAAQFEMALQFLAPEILDAQVNGQVASRIGNRKQDAAPQGIYKCKGKNQWCAIAVDTDAQWDQLCLILGQPKWTEVNSLGAVENRIECHDLIDCHLNKWTSTKTPLAVMELLTSAGVPAGMVQRSEELLKDPQYIHRGFHHYHEHAVMGQVPYSGNQFQILGYQGGPHGPAPLLGQHNHEVFSEILGMENDEIEALIAAGVIL